MLSLLSVHKIELNKVQGIEEIKGNDSLLHEIYWLMGNDTRELSGAGKVSQKFTKNYPKAFWAIRARRDGHEFISGAYKNGIRIFFAESDIKKSALFGKLFQKEDILWIFCKNTRKALGNLAAQYRVLFNAPVIGVTGTNGKTSFKEMLKTLLGPNSFASEKNFNNDLGLPFSLLSVPEKKFINKKEGDSSFVVLEMGMNHRGEIGYLSKIAKPEIGVITSIGPGHLEFLKTINGVTRAKSEITLGMKKGSLLVCNGDSPGMDIVINAARKKQLKLITYGLGKKNDYYPRLVEIHKNKSCFSIFNEFFEMPVLGRHQVANAVGAIVVAKFLGLNPSNLKLRLEKISLPEGRMSIKKKNGIKYILDYYNANPASMAAGFEMIIQNRNDHESGQRILWVLGDMKELGRMSNFYHREIGKKLAAISGKEDRLFAFGENAAIYQKGWLSGGGDPNHAYTYSRDESTELSKSLIKNRRKGDLVFMKGSRSMKMESLLDC